MKFLIIFFSVGTGLLTWGLSLGLVGWLPIWFGLSFLIVAIAYLKLGAKVFGKKSDGKVSLWSLFLLLPYRLVNLGFWYCQRLYFQEECCHQILPNIWLGRRAFAHELPKNISLIVDLTAEFPEPSQVIEGRSYICVPTLDASIPSEYQFRELIDKICGWQGNIYLHCALGHGRAATVAAGILLAQGLVTEVEQAEKWLQKIRPSIGINHKQKELLHRTISVI